MLKLLYFNALFLISVQRQISWGKRRDEMATNIEFHYWNSFFQLLLIFSRFKDIKPSKIKIIILPARKIFFIKHIKKELIPNTFL